MSEQKVPSPQLGWCAMVVATARNFMMESVQPIREQLLHLSADMFGDDTLPLYHGIVDLIGEGRPPGAGDLMARDPEVTLEVVTGLTRFERMFGSLAGATQAVVQESEKRRILKATAEARTAVERGDLTLARALMADASAEGASRALQAASGFEDFTFSPRREHRVSVGLTRLDRLLGGGIGFSGRLTMSLWIAGTGVGKTTVMQGVVVPALLKQGCWVLYFTGEADRDDVMTEVARMHGGTTFEQIEYLARKEVPAVIDRMNRAVQDLRALPGRFIPYDDSFDDSTIRLVAAAYKAEMVAAKQRGEAPEDAELVVIVDNLDHAIESQDARAREDQIYNRAARRFVLDARKHGYHLALLHQTNAEGEKRNGAPLKSDVAFAKAVVNHAAAMLTFHRPTTDEDRMSTERGPNGQEQPGRRARHWAAVRKARGGKVGEIELDSNPLTGVWFDPQHTEAPF